MSEERKRSAIPWIAGVVLVLLGAYVGAYYAMVERVPIRGEPHPFYSHPCQDPHYIDISFDRTIAPWFEPIYWLDRRIRPHLWEARASWPAVWN